MNRVKNGFTLVEILAVVVVLALLMIVVGPTFLDMMATSKTQNRALIYDYIIDATETYLKDVEEGKQYIEVKNIGKIKGYDFIKNQTNGNSDTSEYKIPLKTIVELKYYDEDCDLSTNTDESNCKITADDACLLSITKKIKSSNGYAVIDKYNISIEYNGEELKKDAEDLTKCIK